MARKKSDRASEAKPGPFQGLLPGVLPGPRRALSVRGAYSEVLDQLRDLAEGLTPAQQWELYLLLSRTLYERAVDGWARLEIGLHGLCDGEGI